MTTSIQLISDITVIHAVAIAESTYAEVGLIAIRSEATGLLQLAESLGLEFV